MTVHKSFNNPRPFKHLNYQFHLTFLTSSAGYHFIFLKTNSIFLYNLNFLKKNLIFHMIPIPNLETIIYFLECIPEGSVRLPHI